MNRSQCFFAICFWNIFGFTLSGQEPQGARPDAKPTDPQARMAYVDLVKVHVVGAEEPIKPVARPLYSYVDSVRHIADGGIWAWGEGRPLAMIKSWENPDTRRTRVFSLTSEERVTAHGPQSLVWRPESLQVTPKPLTNTPVPDQSETIRLRRLKEQARRFSAHEMWDPNNSRFEMRLLVQPVHRYRDDKRQIIDGAVFLFAVDNNPQIVLLIEMLATEIGGSRWQYLLARVSSAELHVALDGQEVWSEGRIPGIVGRPTDPYWHMVTVPMSGRAP